MRKATTLGNPSEQDEEGQKVTVVAYKDGKDSCVEAGDMGPEIMTRDPKMENSGAESETFQKTRS